MEGGPWIGFNWRYDSGLVAGPAPCAGGNCNNGPAGTDTVVDTSGLSADQQFEAGLFCGSVHPALPSPGNPLGVPLSSSLGTNLCPASQYGSSLLQIPAPGTENDDNNPPRIAPRNLFDVAVGDDNLFQRRKLQMESHPYRHQHHQQIGALQLPFNLQRDALCDAARADGSTRVPLLADAPPSVRAVGSKLLPSLKTNHMSLPMVNTAFVRLSEP